MPRTKITKNSKRNREAANREEKIRNYEMKMDAMEANLETLYVNSIRECDNKLQMMMSKVNEVLLKMNLYDFLALDLKHFSDFKAEDPSQIQGLGSQSFSNTTVTTTFSATKDVNRNDEGYLTEDSSTGVQSGGLAALAVLTGNNSIAATSGSSNNLHPLRSTKAMRTPGPLHSARALRGRRSRSACGGSNDAPLVSGSAKPKPLMGSNDHSSRSKMRTPMASRSKAYSADRTPMQAGHRRSNSPSTPPLAFLRWPKPGEMALSKCGTPIVAQVMPDKFANVNIPIKNGVLSLRPKKLWELKPDLIDAIDADTLHQIKTLHENLNLIVNMADKASHQKNNK